MDHTIEKLSEDERAFDDVAEELEAFEERLRTCRGGAREVAALRAEVGDRGATLRKLDEGIKSAWAAANGT